MRLLRFRVTNFRSVEDSGWIEADDVTALIGTNESGKTNLLVPLWKLNPAKEGEIDTTADYPRKLFNEFRGKKPQPVFIEAVFAPTQELVAELVERTGASADSFEEISVKRRFDGTRIIDFPKAAPARATDAGPVRTLLETARTDLRSATPLKSEAELHGALQDALMRAAGRLTGDIVSREVLEQIRRALAAALPEEPAKTSVIVPRFRQVLEALDGLVADLSKPAPQQVEGIADLVEEHLPKFVYYSNYGNLDSEIYLPHVIENLKRTDLGVKDQAKARTLKVLFEFVKLSPTEILELGRDFEDTRQNRQPTAQEIEEIAEKKKQRSILLQSASTALTQRFRDWWKQGEYRFRFEADGKHFRIWVSDDKRPEEIELEGRSTGLQWFLSFYLVFLVESKDAHAGAILLLDEPGLSLHPLAQRDLSAFFEGLAETNQLIYTTHSPFMIDADHLDRARKVYVGEDGTTKATSDLRGGPADPHQHGSSYAVHAALGISVAESMLLGCSPVIVEGASDQIYLSGMKTLLVAAGKLRPGRELVFPPAGGVKGVKAVASVLGSREGELPPVLVDGDEAGLRFAQALKSGLYRGLESRVLDVGTIIGMEGAEIEDLIPQELVAREIDRLYREPDTAFSDVVVSGRPIVPQIEAWAAEQGVELTTGWKVDLARRIKQALLTRGPEKLSDEVLDMWTALFGTLAATVGAEAVAG